MHPHRPVVFHYPANENINEGLGIALCLIWRILYLMDLNPNT